jgi:signal transduction histidine kinase
MNEPYRGFLDLVAASVSTALANARAHEEERRKAEALAEIDRAKTAFFSNVSHEFRTPLTLMLGPLEDELAERSSPLPPARRERLETAHRNTLRLLKLVNTLLDFSRIEAGRMQASYEAINLALYTAELASVFRSAVEKGGLTLTVDCPPLPELIYVDRDMWEKIVLNLLSNAFKHTFEGGIRVTLGWRGDHVELVVADSGVGIPQAELLHLFDRFHRVKGAKSRTHEGTGIGLALVQELVHAHGGSVQVNSREGQGSTFSVTVKAGREHLPPERIGVRQSQNATGVRAAAYVDEALHWISEVPAAVARPAPLGLTNLSNGEVRPAASSGARFRILWADDNADMREYVHRLLADHYDVTAVADGAAAVAAALATPPDLVLTDVMMPGLDGFGVLRELRAHEHTRSIPVILLSARAGEESAVEGLEAGADDYLVKPFSARELLARVRTHLELAKLRLEWTVELERRVRERTAELVQTTRELEAEVVERKDAQDKLKALMQHERLRALGQMASGIAHDINNALSPIALYSELLLETEPGLGAQARTYLQTIQRANDDVAATVARLREFYRRREPQLTLAPIDLSTLAQQVVDLTRARWSDMPQQRGIVIELRTEWASDLPAIMGVESEIREALTNLIFNAADAMPEGGTLTLRTKLAATATDSPEASVLQRVDVEVTDTGVGMDENTRRRCLEPFFTTKGERGTGLGLAMVYGVVQRHSAGIEIESTVGTGTTARLSFAVPVAATLAPAQYSTTHPIPTRLRILVVDDDPVLLKALRDALENDGHAIVTANGGQEGIDVFIAARGRSDAFAIVVTDLGMPYVDGRKVASSVKAVSPSTPVILLTGWGERLIAEGDVPPHVDRLLSKPPKLRELREALAHCCGPTVTTVPGTRL